MALTLEVGQVALLVETSLVQAERVDDIDLGLDGVVGTLLSLLSGSVGTSVCALLAPLFLTAAYCGAKHTEGLTTDVDLLAVGLVDNVVDQLKVIGVGDDLVVGDDILEIQGQRKVSSRGASICAGHAGARQNKKAG